MDVLTEVGGLIEKPLRIIFLRMKVPAKYPAHNTEMIIRETNKAASKNQNNVAIEM
jgi:hypothetical protein